MKMLLLKTVEVWRIDHPELIQQKKKCKGSTTEYYGIIIFLKNLACIKIYSPYTTTKIGITKNKDHKI